MKNNLKVERARRSWTQGELAEKVQVSRQTINAIEQGKFNLSTILALKMAAVFEIPLDLLLELEEKAWQA
ncbi:MAG: helix-turn-helix transcriptional regulator [Crocinitomicaceae bacterium]|jgi:putative transcriptional regulator|nr:helix-turn-helix transcriptional regulator [Crocinitomicaceae bacterium]